MASEGRYRVRSAVHHCSGRGGSTRSRKKNFARLALNADAANAPSLATSRVTSKRSGRRSLYGHDES